MLHLCPVCLDCARYAIVEPGKFVLVQIFIFVSLVFNCIRYLTVVSVVLSVSDMLWLFQLCVCQVCDRCVMCILYVLGI